MKRDDTSPAAYISSIGDAWQKDLVQDIRDLILEFDPDAEEYIEYGMLAYGDLANLAAQKHHVALYVNPAALAVHKKRHPGVDCGKSCLRFRSKEAFDSGEIEELMATVQGMA